MGRVKNLFIAFTLLIAGPTYATIQFVAGDVFQVSAVPDQFATGDFNRDGIEDLVLSAQRSDEINVLFGDVEPRFRRGIVVRLGRALVDVEVADLNQDTLDDILVLDSPNRFVALRKVWVLLGKGDGTFRDPYEIVLTEANDPFFLKTADFDRDGDIDFAVSDRARLSRSVFIMLNDGNTLPRFTVAAELPAERNPKQLAIGDFDGDGDTDVAVLNSGGPRTKDISVYRNDGKVTGTEIMAFREVAQFETGKNPFSLEAADMNGDGLTDLIMLDNPPGNLTSEIQILTARFELGTLNFDGPSRVAVPCPVQAGDRFCFSRVLNVGDFDLDGNSDVAVSIINPHEARTTDFMTIFRGRPDGQLIRKLTIDTITGPRGIAIGQFTGGDSFPDIALAIVSRSQMQLYLNLSTTPSPNGSLCQEAEDCESEFCIDGFCCEEPCLPTETCGSCGREGICVPKLNLGEECCVTPGQPPFGGPRHTECLSGNCTDGVCCNVKQCSRNRRCDIDCDVPPTEDGMCTPLHRAGECCEIDDHCEPPLFCTDGVCCHAQACFEGEICAPSGSNCPPGDCCPVTPTPTPIGLGGRCDRDEDCQGGLFCTDGVCCVARECPPGQHCAPAPGPDAGTCVLGPTRTATPTNIPKPTIPTRTIKAKTSRGGGCAISDDPETAASGWLLLMLPALLVGLRRLRQAACRIE